MIFFIYLFSFASYFWQVYHNSMSQLLWSHNKSLPPWEMKASLKTGNSVPFEQCVGSFTSHRVVNIEELRDGTYGLLSLTKKTRELI